MVARVARGREAAAPRLARVMTGHEPPTDREPAIVVDHVSKRFRVPKERYHTLKERALHGFRRTRWEVLEGLHDVSFSVAPGEFFGVVGRNGSGKSTLLKCVAGIYRTDARRDRGQRAPVHLHRAWRRLQPRPRGGGQRRAERDPAGPRPARGARARRQRDRVRRARGVPRPEAQELLVRDVRAACVRRDDPGGRRHPPDRRGARGRRCRLPAEVLHGVRAPARRGPHDRVRHARHARRQPVLPPRAAAGARRGDRDRRSQGGDRPVHGGQLPRGARRRRDRAGRASSTTAPPTSRTPGSRTSTASGASTSPPATSVVCKVQVNFNWALVDPALVARDRERQRRGRVRDVERVERAPHRALRGRRAGACFSVSFDSFLAPGRYYVSPQVALLEGEHAGVVDRRDRAAGVRRHGRGRPRARRPARRTSSPSSASACASCRRDGRGARLERQATGRTERRRFLQILVALAVTEFKTRYFGSVLGYLWSLMRPLMVFGVLYVVFTHVVRFGGDIEHYPLKLLLAIVLWSFFAEATGAGAHLAGGPRGPAAEGPVPARGRAAVGRAHRGVQPGSEPVRRDRVRAGHRHRPGRERGWS